MLSRIKDAALEKGLLVLLRPQVERYGDLRDISLDTSKRKLTAEVHLRGDAEPLTVHQAHYRLEQDGDRVVLVVSDIKVSREWLQNLVNDHFKEVRLKVPENLRPVIARLF